MGGPELTPPRPPILEGTTPGPWWVSHVGTKGGWDVANTGPKGGHGIIAVVPESTPSEANARLIAAAPDLAKENEELRALVVDAGKALSLEYAPAGDLEAWFKRVEKFATAILEREKP